MMMKILILGATGGLGSDCRKVLGKEHEVICPGKEEVDVVSWDVVIEAFDTISPDIVLNCVGLTDLDTCERDPFALRKINVEGPRNLAQSSARFGCKIVHVSCAHVFDGRKAMPQPYFEDDAPNPLSAYGKSKLESETAVRGNSPNYIIIRSNWLYGVHGSNFVKSVVQHAVRGVSTTMQLPDDQFGAPTWSHRLALQIRELLNQDGRGSYHATAYGYCSPFELAQYVLDKLKLKAAIEACSLSTLSKGHLLPVNCVLENSLSKKQGVNVMVNWEKDLDTFLEQFGDQLIKEADL
jgi:dTDP-4-dehydrorhamnose reductase